MTGALGLNKASEKTSLTGQSRMIRKVCKHRKPSDADDLPVRRCVERVAELTERLASLSFEL